ncbi:MAG: hypothetical protein U0Q16_27190 [Bryobacteraceae bacterium]
MVTCPLCDAEIDVEEEDLDEGDVLSCDECGATLNVSGLDPLELQPESDDEDEEDDEDYVDDEDEDEEDEDEDDEDW